jgi:HEAT repeat protein
MAIPTPIPLSKLIDALLDESTPFSPRYLNRLSDLDREDAQSLADNWPKISIRRRQALLEDLEEVHLADDLLSFEEVGRIGLTDSDPGVRMRAIQILREYELIDLLPVCVHMSENDPDAEVRAASTAALATYIYLGEVEDISPKKLKQVEECLLRLHSGSDTTLVRRRALEALGFSSREEVPGLIKQAYASTDTDWLITALFAMGRSANSRWNPQVLKMLTHPHPLVRAEAASSAGELEISAAVPMLLDMLDDSDVDVRMASVWALSQVGGNGVRQALENLLEITEDEDEANQIDNALENLDFTEEMKDLALLEIPEDGDGANESLVDDYNNDDYKDDDYEDEIDDLNSEDDED